MTQEELMEIALARAEECRLNMYKSETKVWKVLQRHNDTFGLEWQTQIPIIIPYELKDYYSSKAFYIADFLEPNCNIIVEVDGEQHNAYNDKIRDEVLKEIGYTTYRIKSLDVWKYNKLKVFMCDLYNKERIWFNRYAV